MRVMKGWYTMRICLTKKAIILWKDIRASKKMPPLKIILFTIAPIKNPQDPTEKQELSTEWIILRTTGCRQRMKNFSCFAIILPAIWIRLSVGTASIIRTIKTNLRTFWSRIMKVSIRWCWILRSTALLPIWEKSSTENFWRILHRWQSLRQTVTSCPVRRENTMHWNLWKNLRQLRSTITIWLLIMPIHTLMRKMIFYTPATMALHRPLPCSPMVYGGKTKQAKHSKSWRNPKDSNMRKRTVILNLCPCRKQMKIK